MLEEPLIDDEFWLVGRTDAPVFKTKRLEVTAPVAERLLLLAEGHCLREHTLSACGRATTPNRSGIEATSLLTLVQMVESGLGLALVPEIALKSGLLANTRLVARPLAPPAPKRTLALVAWPSTASKEELARLAQTIVERHRRERRAVTTSAGRCARG
jgi:LysR family hydrogen peroxide-inducible transcriptional activator